MKPRDIQTINNVLAIVWEDGGESYFEFERLRRACPCATCQGERNILLEARPAPPNYTPASFQLTAWRPVGGYAIQPQWAYGHNTGLYSFEYLRDLEKPA
jgi:DUF971 family protein